MKQCADAAQLRGLEMATEISQIFQSSAVDIASSPTLMGLSDVLDSTVDWLSGQNGDLRELLGCNPKQNTDSAREQKLANCLKELAAFQRSAVEELQEDDAPQPKDLNSTLFSAGCIQPCQEKNNKPVPEVCDTVSKVPRPKGAEVNAVKNIKRREVKEVQHKSWSNSTRSPVRPLHGVGVKSDKPTRPTNKSPNVAANSRQYVIHSNPLASGRRLSAAGSKRKDSIVTLQKSPTKCKRMSSSPAIKSKPAENKRTDVGGPDGNVAGGKSCLEKTPTSKSKVPRLTDRQKEILKRVMMNSPMSAKKMTQREKNNALLSSVDLSAAGRRARRLSQVLRNEHEITHQNHQYAEELHQLQRQYAIMEDEADRAQSAGMLLRQVWANQAEELKAYKEAFPTLYKDLTGLRDDYQKREEELKLEIRAKLSLQAEVSKLRERVDSLSTDIKQTRTLNTVLAERVQQHEKTQCTSCRLYINQKPVKKAISPMAVKKAGHPLETPPRPRSELKFGKRNSPRLSVVPITEVEKDVHQENKKTFLIEPGEDTYNCKKESEQHDSALHARNDNVPQKPSSTDCPPVDALKSRINSLLLTASQAVES